MSAPEKLAIVCAGAFFLMGLLTGIWKYRQIVASETGHAHPYVDICHRASLLYAFAAMLLAKFAEISQLPERTEFVAMTFVLFYFASAIFTYMIHGLLQDTDNQLKPPFGVGKVKLPGICITLFMWTLIAGEIGGFLVLFYGVLIALF